jgi:toxin YoeB
VKIRWTTNAASDLNYWKKHNQKTVDRIRQLLKDMTPDPFVGIAKPEPLKYKLAGLWSRRINREHRLVYRVDDDTITIISARYHYN